MQILAIDAEFAGQRIDNFLVTYLKGMPKTRVYRILRKGEVRVNKKRIQPGYRLQEGDQVRLPPLYLDDRPVLPVPSLSVVELLSERIIYEDNHLMIINKPSGIPVHGGSQISLGVIEILRNMYPRLEHLELAHRIDADTSGCLILAKKRSILKEIHELLREGKVHKVYLALTKGHWTAPELRVEASLKKNFLASGERIVRVDNEGKPSLTVFEPIKKYGDAMLVKAVLHTGRTHQIRVHARHRSHPLAGDEKYGDRDFNKKMRKFGVKRLFLHSHIIEFTLPSTDQTIKVVAPLAQELQDSLDKIEMFQNSIS